MDTNNIFSYTKRSYEEARQEGISKIPLISNGDWTDTNSTDPGIVILDYVHALVDMVQYYQDHNALESFLSTAKERKNIFRLAQQTGYKIRGSTGSTVDVTFSVDKISNKTIVIPMYTKISTNDGNPIYYLTTEESYIYAGSTEVTVPCVQGERLTTNYTGTGESSLDNILLPANQSVKLTVTGIDLDSIVVYDSKVVWEAVTNVLFSNPNTKEYSTYLNYDGTVTVQFGNDERGYTPKTTDTINIDYTYSLGEDGRVAANSIVSIHNNSFKYDDGTGSVHLYVNNKLSSVGGSYPEDSETIREESPNVIKAQDRAVTLSDFETLAKRVSGVLYAKAYDINKAPDICSYYEIKLLIITDSQSSSKSVENSVKEYISRRIIPPTVFSIISPVYETIDISVNIVASDSYTDDNLKYNITRVLKEYFSTLSTSLGYDIIPNILITKISTVAGVEYVESISPSSIRTLNFNTLPSLGNVTVNVGRR